MNLVRIVKLLADRFASARIDNPRRTAEELLANALKCGPMEIYTRDTRDLLHREHDLLAEIEPLAKRIEQGEPLQYVIGHVDFWGLDIQCDSRALIPRPETELLVEEVLNTNMWKRKNAGPATVVDVGTGTGCVVLALAKQRTDANFKAVDVSSDALELAKTNAMRNQLEGRVFWMRNDLLERFAPESADIVVANLPYIATDDWRALEPVVREHEPRLALDSGPDGLELINELATQARYVLVPGGMLFLEFGFDQGERVRERLENLGYQDVRIKHDLADHDRMAIATNP